MGSLRILTSLSVLFSFALPAAQAASDADSNHLSVEAGYEEELYEAEFYDEAEDDYYDQDETYDYDMGLVDYGEVEDFSLYADGEIFTLVEDCMASYGLEGIVTTLTVTPEWANRDDETHSDAYTECITAADKAFNDCRKTADKTYPDWEDFEKKQEAKAECNDVYEKAKDDCKSKK